MKTNFFILIVLIFVSCGRSAKTNENNNDLQTEQDSIVEQTEFQQYLSHFDIIKLPMNFQLCSYEFEQKLYKSNYNFDDNEYQEFKQDYFCVAFGKFTTDNYIATIILPVGDCLAPRLFTYSYDGKIIDKKEIFITDMDDSGYRCVVNTLINSDLSILITDSVTIYEVDTVTGEEKDVIMEKYVLYKKGQITKSGKIELSKMQRKKIE